jgi:hypothetical protein
MSKPRTRWILFALVAFTGLLLVLILPLIGSIGDISFLPGRSFELSTTEWGGGTPPEAPGWSMFTLLMRVLLVIAFAMFIIQFLTNREARKIYIIVILVLAAVLLLVDYVGCNRQEPEEVTSQEIEDSFDQPAQADLDIQPIERPVESSGAIYVILAIALSTLVVVIGGAFVAKWLKTRPVAKDDGYEEILDSISNAAHRIRAGEDPYTVVLFCYQEMIRILSMEGRIDATYLTPREFEHRLQSLGLSGQSIAQLTEIFEVVRYAGRVDDAFAARALACLEAIQKEHTPDEP